MREEWKGSSGVGQAGVRACGYVGISLVVGTFVVLVLERWDTLPSVYSTLLTLCYALPYYAAII
jgi:hypothetical protein